MNAETLSTDQECQGGHTMLKIWGRANSVNVKKVLWCASELGIEFDRIDAGGKFGVVDMPEFRAKNPNGLIPCIEDDGFVLWESNSIIRYLVARYGEHTTLSPATLEARASADKWMDWANQTLMPHYSTLIKQCIRTPNADQNAASIQIASKCFNQAMVIANEALTQSRWFSGNEFGLGDIPVGTYVACWSLIATLERPSLPALERWLRQLHERPCFRQWVDVPLT